MNETHPFVYALLPDKRQVTYERLLSEIKNLIPLADPHVLSTDFERAAINAVDQVFPNTQVAGCFFHFCQNIYRKMQREGLGVRYQNDANWVLRARMIPALAFVPIEHLEHYFNDLSAHLDAKFPELEPILNYFEDTYLGRPGRNARAARRRPLFPHELWNVYERTVHGLARTNNAVEAWHRGASATFAMQHPTFWKFLAKLKNEQQHRDAIFEGLIAGRAPVPKRRKYVDLNAQIVTIVTDFQNRATLDYLRGIAHSLSF